MQFNKAITKKDFLKAATSYAKVHGENPNELFCPKLYLFWANQSGYKYKKLPGGKRTYNGVPENVGSETMYAKSWQCNDNTKAYTIKANRHYLWLYVRPDYNRRVMEFSTITIPTGRRLDNYKYEFIGRRYLMSMDNPKMWAFIDIDCAFMDANRVKMVEDGRVHKVPQSYYTEWYFNSYKITTWVCSGFHCNNNVALNMIREYLQNFGITEVYNGYNLVSTKTLGMWDFARFISNGPHAKKNTKDTRGEELAALQLPQITNKLITTPNKDGIPVAMINCYYKKINDNLCVFRYFTPIGEARSLYSNYVYKHSLAGMTLERATPGSKIEHKETSRVYVENKKVYLCTRACSDANGPKFVYKRLVNPIDQMLRNHIYLCNADQMAKDPQFKYVYEIYSKSKNICTMLTSMNKPIIEQLIKIGANTIAGELASNNEVMANMKRFLGTANAKKKTLQEVMGMTTKQILLIENEINKTRRSDDTGPWYYVEDDKNLYMVTFIYELLSGKPYHSNLNNISSYNENTIAQCVDIMHKLVSSNALRRHWGYYVEHMDPDTMRYENTFKALFPRSYRDKEPNQRVKYITKMMKFCNQQGVGINTLLDNVRMYNDLHPEYRPANVSFDYKCASDITRLHDSLVELTNIQNEERRRLQRLAEDKRNAELEKKMKKLDEQRKLMEFEDDEYLIRLPKKLSELTDEGSHQRICIGGYINAHASGSSNIYFLRKKSNPDIPFFAIEEKDGKIVQIHGYCNKWLGADDESFAAVPFVMRWLKRNNLRCSNDILTSRACGYSMGGSFRELPVID